MSEDTHEHELKPRWDKIEKLHDLIDKGIDDSFKDDKLSFMEVDFALLMISEKIAQQKIELYNLYMKEQGDEDATTKKAPDNLYR